MKKTIKKLTIRDLISGYKDSGNDGVVAFDGLLDVRPAYQREFIYKDKQRNAVIDTVLQTAPLNNMYWVLSKEGKYEQLDGQQRTISICQYVTGEFTFNGVYFHTLPKSQQENFLNYELQLYICEGTETEKYSWFERINIAGAVLTKQELRNGIFVGTWLSDAKEFFSKPNCPAYKKGKNYLKGSAIRQDYLETAIKWATNSTKEDNVKRYMSEHQFDKNAKPLYEHFEKVVNWTEKLFPTYRNEMKGVDWGALYAEHKDEIFDTEMLEGEVRTLMTDDTVTNNKGIYPYLITRDTKYLNIRAFSNAEKRKVYEQQEGVCSHCYDKFDINEMQGDHIEPFSRGGRTVIEN